MGHTKYNIRPRTLDSPEEGTSRFPFSLADYFVSTDFRIIQRETQKLPNESLTLEYILRCNF